MPRRMMAASPRPLGARSRDDPHDPTTAHGVPPTIDSAPGLSEEAPGLFDQVGATRDSVKRLAGAHVELAKAEFEDIADSVKRAAVRSAGACCSGSCSSARSHWRR